MSLLLKKFNQFHRQEKITIVKVKSDSFMEMASPHHHPFSKAICSDSVII